MEFDRNDIDSRLSFYSELMSDSTRCFMWAYDSAGNLMHTNCEELVLNTIFQHNASFAQMLEHAQRSTSPLLITGRSGIMWGACVEYVGDSLGRIHVLGPLFSRTMSNLDFEHTLQGTSISIHWKSAYIRLMQSLPVMSTTAFMHRLISMEYCVSGRHLQISDIVMLRDPNEPAAQSKQENTDAVTDRIQVYMAEQSMLQMIRDGNTNYQPIIQRATHYFNGKQSFSSDSLQHTKLGQVQFVALCCAAAVEGGLSVEAAYNRKDAYVQDIENAKEIAGITKIGLTMYVDYINLVHQQRTNPEYSKTVRSTCDYIENHLHEKITAETLAKRVGYSCYYLTRIFKRETGMSIASYTCFARIERAKLLLSSTQDSIQDIADALGFSGRNYFATTFCKVTGMPPAAYRKKSQSL